MSRMVGIERYFAAMASQNLELAHRAYEALRADDIERFLGYVDPEVQWRSLLLEVEGVYHGHDGVREWWRNLTEVFPDWKPSIAEAREYGDLVVVHAEAKGSATGSGLGVEEDFWQVAQVRDGRIVWYAAFRDEEGALEAVALRGGSE